VNSDVRSILSALPQKVVWQDVAQFENVDERVLLATHIGGDIVGMSYGFVEWCPNNDPPSELETFLWWWVVRPDLGAAIAYEADEETRLTIADYTARARRPVS
jgi:hypothetical protein